MKHPITTPEIKLEIVAPNHPLWPKVTQQLCTRYEQAFDAKLATFMPEFMALTIDGEIKSLCGFRSAGNEALFLEQYLDDKAEVLLRQHFDTEISRSSVIEFGQLASFAHGNSPIHFFLMAEKLVEQGYEWCIFTATDPLHALMKRLGLSPIIIAEASPERVPEAEKIWGTYYQHKPRVLAGNLIQGYQHLLHLFHEANTKVRG
ncbi:thermostable hemolysin [Vibrio nereis]|uniref:thermostable hemolysin n=1 Tax=Vibrio nereis TaxID=693 RepID=UPI0024954ADE|nr:thermostable hemolysin [Vibrio nereis]